jgi:hypothetical protein
MKQTAMNNILNNAREYLVEFLKGKQHHFESKHPWRKEWEFVVLHSLQVEEYATKILKHEQHNLSDTEIMLLRLAAILHDIGRLEITDDHAVLGAQITGGWLSKPCNNWLTKKQKDSVFEMIAEHSKKENPESDFSKAVLKDSDTLDEIGVMSIFMSSNWIDHHSPFFFHDLRQRLIEFEIPFCDRKLSILNTDGAKAIMSKKRIFIESFITQIIEELESEVQIKQLLR